MTKKIKKGDLLYFYPNLLHSMHVTQEPYLKFFATHMTIENADALPFSCLQKTNAPIEIYELYEQLRHIAKSKPYLYKWKQNLKIEQIILLLFEDIQRKEMDANSDFMQHLIDDIHKNPTANWNIEDMVKNSGLCKTTFIKLFREITNTTVLQYIICLKIEYAKDYIMNENKSIQEIALLCGFNDPYYFSRCFKKQTGVSPSEFRKLTSFIPIL